MNRIFFVVGIAVSLFGSSAAFLPFFLDAYGLPKLACGAIGAMILALNLGERGVRPSSLWKPIGWLAFVCALSWTSSSDPAVAWLGVYSQPFHALVLFAQAAIIFGAVRTAPWEISAIPAAAAAGLILNALFCGLQALGPGAWGHLVNGRAVGTMGNPAFLGGWAAISLPLAAGLIRHERRGLAALGVAGAACGAFVILASGSRGAFLAALAGSWALAWGLGALRARRWHFAAILGLLVALAASGAALGRARSDPFRLATWRAAARAWAARPINGWGPEAFPIANRAMRDAAHVRAIGNDGMIQASAHNDLLQVAATLGTAGLIWWLLLWLELYLTTRRAVDVFHAPELAGAAGALAAFFVQAKLNPITIPAVLTAAAAAGIVASEDCQNWRGPRWPLASWLLACSLALASVLSIGRAVIAESLFVTGNTFFARGRLAEGADYTRAAQELRPEEATYALARINRIMELAKIAPPQRRRAFAFLTIRIAGQIARARPNDPASWELLSASQMFAANVLNDRRLAAAALTSARASIAIDPFFSNSHAQAKLAARGLGNFEIVGEESRAIAELARMIQK